MKIYITLDYELFFGEKSGSVDDCIINPTQALLDIVEPLNVKLTCFVDSGYLLALEKQKSDFPQLQRDYNKITKQIKYLATKGHGIELHVHPHWEDSYYDEDKWIFNMKRYKLASFNENDVLDIITRYTEVLTRISGTAPVAYRAGGWSAQPFEPIKKGLEANNIFIDSTVFPKGFHNSEHQVFNFKNISQYNTEYKFLDDLTVESNIGKFTEIPISSFKVSPFFFWKFALKKKLKNPKHITYGKGSAISMPLREKLRLLSRFSYSVVSIDGYKSVLINKAYKIYKKQTKDNGNFVLIGHPKAFTSYSLQKVEEFVKKYHKTDSFMAFKLE